jgi:NTE family protein
VGFAFRAMIRCPVVADRSTRLPVRELPRPVGFVFSGGSALCALHAGMLRAVHEAGLAPDLLIGTGAGAMNAAFIGVGFTALRVAELAEFWRAIGRTDVFARRGLWQAVRAILGRDTLASTARIRAFANRYLPPSHADLAIPTTVVAADQATGDVVLLGDGDLRSNVMASIAIPRVFPPVASGGRMLVGGGAAANVPILPARDLGCRAMVVFDAGFPCTLRHPPRHGLERILYDLTTRARDHVVEALPLLGSGHTVVYLPAPCPLSIAPHDFRRSAELIDEGYAATSTFLKRLRIDRAGVYGGPHVHP